MDNLILKIDNVSKQYKLGEIGGTTLRDELQRFRAKLHKREDPTKRIGVVSFKKGEKFMALDGVSFEARKGERIGIIGHNGAGKSTLLKLISRVTAPTSGEIGLNGRVASMLEVGTGFHPELTGRENVYMNGAILGMTKKEIDSKIEDIIEFSEVRQFIDTPVKRYSSGMYVKLAFSVAAHLDSEIMIMDEVLAVGDMAFQRKCIDKMNAVSKEFNRTILYVSHNMSTIRQLCDRVIVLEKGKLIFDGDVEEGIKIYSNQSKSIASVSYDLRNVPREKSYNMKRAKINSLILLNKHTPQYYKGEKLIFETEIESFESLMGLKYYLTIKKDDDTPIGFCQQYVSMPELFANKEYIFKFSIDIDNLRIGRYYFQFFLVSDNGKGLFYCYDHPMVNIQFEVIEDGENVLKINPNKCGNVILNEIKLLK